MGKYSDMAAGSAPAGGKYSSMAAGAVRSDATDPQASAVDGMSGLDRFRAGLAGGVLQAGGLIKNALNDASVALADTSVGRVIDRAGQSMGLSSAADVKARNDAGRAEFNRVMAPLNDTASGKAGNIVGTVATLLPTAAIPGANTWTGAALIGGGAGAILSETGERDTGAATGAIGGVVGKGLGLGLAKGVTALKGKVAESVAARAPMVGQQQAAVRTARELGYTVPPTMANPSGANRLLEGFAGKLTTGQQASLKNQEVTNRLIRNTFGLADDVPLNTDTMGAIRSQAGKAYDDLANFGTFSKDAAYDMDLAKIRKPLDTFAKDFPDLANNEVDGLLNAINRDRFDSGAAIEALKRFRFDGNANKISLDPEKKALGRVQLQAADAMESMIERNLQKFVGGDEMLNSFRNARQTIAKTYTVEKALNSQTGNVNALKLADQLRKGKPLSGDIKKAAQFAEAFKTAAKEPTSSPTGTSPLDWAAAGGISAMSANPYLLALAGARPAVRATILSRPYQNLMTMPGTPTVSPLLELAAKGASSRVAQQSMPAIGIGSSLEALRK